MPSQVEAYTRSTWVCIGNKTRQTSWRFQIWPSKLASRFRSPRQKAELAVIFTNSFREDINGLHDALQRANELIATLQAGNDTIKGAF